MTQRDQSVTPVMRVGRRGEQKRRWDEAHRRRCACGRLTSSHNTTRCLICHRRDQRAPVEARWDYMERAWAAGATRKEMAAHLGKSVNYISVEMARARRAGRDLPLRPPGGLR